MGARICLKLSRSRMVGSEGTRGCILATAFCTNSLQQRTGTIFLWSRVATSGPRAGAGQRPGHPHMGLTRIVSRFRYVIDFQDSRYVSPVRGASLAPSTESGSSNLNANSYRSRNRPTGLRSPRASRPLTSRSPTLSGASETIIDDLEEADYDGDALSMLLRTATALRKRIDVQFVTSNANEPAGASP